MLKSLIAASLACATVLSSAAYAGPIPQNYYYRTSQNVKINYALPFPVIPISVRQQRRLTDWALNSSLPALATTIPPPITTPIKIQAS